MGSRKDVYGPVRGALGTDHGGGEAVEFSREYCSLFTLASECFSPIWACFTSAVRYRSAL